MNAKTPVYPAHASDRRTFLSQTLRLSGAMAAVHVGGTASWGSDSRQEKLNIAAIGVANKGRHNLDQLTDHNIVALCDIDANYLHEAAMTFTKAKLYRDYRKLMDEMASHIDAVVVSTADHTHAPITSIALQLGKHVYCEKPLTHTVAEARAIATLAKKQKVVTQMGTQIHADENYRRVVELIRAGVIGKINEVYTWCGKGWSGGKFRPDSGPPPAHLDWDLWLGPAPSRPYSDNLHPANWRRFWDYGSGTLGDMGCHVMDLPFWALDLTFPSRVGAEGPPPDMVGAPHWCKVAYEFSRPDGTPVKLYWADGGANYDLVKETRDADNQPASDWGLGILFVGSEGKLLADYGRRQLLPVEKFRDFQPPEPSIAKSIGHWKEWTEACKGQGTTSCHFGYAGLLTEGVLLGVVSYRSEGPIIWQADSLSAPSNPRAQEFLSKRYRAGFEVVGLS